MSEPGSVATFLTAGVVAALGVTLVAMSVHASGAGSAPEEVGYTCATDVVIGEDGSNLCAGSRGAVEESSEEEVVDDLLKNRDGDGSPGTYPWFLDIDH